MISSPHPAHAPNGPPGEAGHPKYRPDIDGLRAIAVLLVVGFHGFPPWIPGGFIGVDIFFVISGFLISTIIFGSLKSSQFSFTDFYSRRVRRIFPALITVLIASFAAGWFLLLPDEYLQLGKHITGSAGFVSNFLLWTESGYFDEAAETKPLLHLWSLGIEEQFYLVYPLAIWVAAKFRINFLAVTLAIAAGSFAFGVYYLGVDPAAAFYFPHARFWELMLGSLFAYQALHGSTPRPAGSVLFRNVSSLLGLALIAYGVFAIDSETRFPGGWALLPTLGALLLIAGGARTWPNRVLSNRVLVWIGVISYPLYLWHWVLLSFSRIIVGELAPINTRISLVVASVVLAWVTNRTIERPLRFGGKQPIKVAALGIAMVITGCVGYAAFHTRGFPRRSIGQVVVANQGDIGHGMFYEYAVARFHPCTPAQVRDQALSWKKYVRCQQSKAGGPIDLAIVGDSHAEQLFIGLAESLPGKNVAYYIKASLPVIANNAFDDIFAAIVENPHLKQVLLTAFWSKKGVHKEQLAATLKYLQEQGKQVFLTDDIPNFGFDPAKCKYQGRPLSNANLCAQQAGVVERQKAVTTELREVAAAIPGVELIRTSRYLCNETECFMKKDRRLLYRDWQHLNINGSQFVGESIVRDTPALQQ